MKATGIVRRIDDLGRIVIPKEIHRTCHLREGDPIEIYLGENGEIILQKYGLEPEITAFRDTIKEISEYLDYDERKSFLHVQKKQLTNIVKTIKTRKRLSFLKSHI